MHKGALTPWPSSAKALISLESLPCDHRWSYRYILLGATSSRRPKFFECSFTSCMHEPFPLFFDLVCSFANRDSSCSRGDSCTFCHNRRIPKARQVQNFLLWSMLSTEAFQNFIVFQSAFASTFQFEDRNFSITPSTKCLSGAFKGRITTAVTSCARKVSSSDAFAQLSQRQDTQLKSI